MFDDVSKLSDFDRLSGFDSMQRQIELFNSPMKTNIERGSTILYQLADRVFSKKISGFCLKSDHLKITEY